MRASKKWQEILGRFQDSRLTVAEFCRIEGVSTASFYQWRRKLAEPQDTSPDSKPTPLFLPVQLSPAEPTRHDEARQQPSCLELALSSGHVLRIPDHAPQHAIANVLAALGVS